MTLLQAHNVWAQSSCPVLELNGPVKGKALSGFVGALEDINNSRTARNIAGKDAPGFETHYGKFPDFGYTSNKIWLRLCLLNRTNKEDWRLYIHENFFQEFDVHLARSDGSVTELVNLDPNSPFSSRAIADPELIVPFVITRDETATLLIRYRSGGASQMDFSLETMGSFNASSTRRTAKNFIFYGMMLLLVSAALASLLIFRHVVFLAYSGYAISALLFVMHGDGTAFQYLWPTLPGLNGNASILTGGGLIISGSAYARVFLKTENRHPHIDKLLWALIILTPVVIVTLFVPNSQLLKKLLIMLSLFSVLSFTAAGLFSYLSGHKDVRFYTLAWLGALVSSGLMNLRHVVGLEIPQETVHDSIRVVMVLDAIMMGLAIADRYNQMRRGRQTALEGNLVATRQRLDLNRRLADLQARHDLAVELSKSRDRHIQNVVHDLRQPLHALRLNVMSLTSDKPVSGNGETPQNVEAAFGYLETLIAKHLEPGPDHPDEIDPETPDTDPYTTQDGAPDLQDILAAIGDMFQPDAKTKNLSLRLVPSQINRPVADALTLTRILSNLVSNAIKYTDTGGVLIGARQRQGVVSIEIHDTGPGMTQQEFERALGRDVRLEQSRRKADGKGLGLAIAIDLATRNGFTLKRCQTRRSGTGLVLTMPMSGARLGLH